MQFNFLSGALTTINLWPVINVCDLDSFSGGSPTPVDDKLLVPAAFKRTASGAKIRLRPAQSAQRHPAADEI